MKIVKAIHNTIDLKSVRDLYSPNYDQMILQKLKDKFVGVCFKSMYITEIKDIIYRTNFILKRKDLSGGATCDVIFNAAGIVYEKGEVIHNCEIIKIEEDGSMIAKNDIASIKIDNNTGASIYKVGNKAPFLVEAVGYNPYSTEITIYALPLQPITMPIKIYQLDKKKQFVISNTNEVVAEISAIEAEIVSIKKAKSKMCDIFKKLLYPYKEMQKFDKKNKTCDVTNIDELYKAINDNKMLYVPVLEIDDNRVFITEDRPAIGIICELSADEIVINLLLQYKKNITIFLEFLTVYDTPEKAKDLNLIWSVYNTLKFD